MKAVDKVCGWCRKPYRGDPRTLFCSRSCTSSCAADTARRALVEDVEWLLESGESVWEIARRVYPGKSPKSLSKRLRSAGRCDLAVLFDPIGDQVLAA